MASRNRAFHVCFLDDSQSLEIAHKSSRRVKPPFGLDELRIVGRFVLHSLSHDLACRLAKRRGLANSKDAHDW
jgi:hypothetical protein